VVFGKLGNLEKPPDLPVAGGLAEENKGLPRTVSFVVDFGIFAFDCGHGEPQQDSNFPWRLFFKEGERSFG
jgi:hypothetical protein